MRTFPAEIRIISKVAQNRGTIRGKVMLFVAVSVIVALYHETTASNDFYPKSISYHSSSWMAHAFQQTLPCFTLISYKRRTRAFISSNVAESKNNGETIVSIPIPVSSKGQTKNQNNGESIMSSLISGSSKGGSKKGSKRETIASLPISGSSKGGSKEGNKGAKNGSLPISGSSKGGSKKEHQRSVGKTQNRNKIGMRQKPIIPERSFASLEPSHFSQYSSYLEEAVLNSIHNATVQELITTVSEDGLTLLHQVYGTLDCSPDAAPVKLTVPLSMSQQRRNDTTTPMTGPWEVGQRLKVRITEIDPTSDEITSCALVVTSSTSKLAPSTSSSRKALVEMLPYLGKLVSGRVISTTAYGAFLDIGCKNKNAILHKSRITRTTRVDNVTEFISVGQTLTVRLIEVDIDKGSMALSMLSDKSEQYLQWRKQHAEIRNYRAAARAAASIFDEDNEATKTIANALLDRMNQEEGSKDTKEEEILQGQWGFV